MTCIVGLIDNGKVYIGGDSCVSRGYVQQTMSSPKVFRNGHFLIGYSGSLRMAELLRFAFSPPEHPKDISTERYFATLFADALRTTLKDAGNATKNNEQESSTGYFLVGYQGRLITIEADYSFTEVADGWDAIGSGNEVALGAMHATKDMSLIPQKRIELALDAASTYCRGVCGPFTVEVLE